MVIIKEKPYMWVPKQESEQQVKYYRDNKLKDLGERIGIQQDIGYVLGNFFGFIKYLENTYKGIKWLRVYLGVAFGKDAPHGFNKKWVMIFAPVDASDQDLGYYFLDKPFDESLLSKFTITKEQKDKWTWKFEDDMPLGLIDLTHIDNQEPKPRVGHKKELDTRCIRYCFADLLDLMAAKEVFAKEASQDVMGMLASYNTDGKPSEPFKGRFINRTIIQFELMEDGNLFYLDNIQAFTELPQRGSSICGDEQGLSQSADKFTSDKGQLCPFNCPD